MEVHPLVTLHLPPPDTFTLESNFCDFSRMVTCALGWFSFAAIAAKNPAAPPPIIAMVIDFACDGTRIERIERIYTDFFSLASVVYALDLICYWVQFYL